MCLRQPPLSIPTHFASLQTTIAGPAAVEHGSNKVFELPKPRYHPPLYHPAATISHCTAKTIPQISPTSPFGAAVAVVSGRRRRRRRRSPSPTASAATRSSSHALPRLQAGPAASRHHVRATNPNGLVELLPAPPHS